MTPSSGKDIRKLRGKEAFFGAGPFADEWLCLDCSQLVRAYLLLQRDRVRVHRDDASGGTTDHSRFTVHVCGRYIVGPGMLVLMGAVEFTMRHGRYQIVKLLKKAVWLVLCLASGMTMVGGIVQFLLPKGDPSLALMLILIALITGYYLRPQKPRRL